MAGDRRVSCDWGFSYKCPYPKIKKKENGILIGASGDSGLCKLVVDIFEPPEIDTDVETYMFFKFLPRLTALIKSQPGYQDEHKLLRLSSEESCSMLVAAQGRLFTVDISNPEGDLEKSTTIGRIILDDAPIPYAIGCGSSTALPILFAEQRKDGYNTKEGLINAVEIACEVSPGCSLPLDLIQES